MKNSRPTLTIIGAGKVGKVFGRQFHRHQVFTVSQVLNRSLPSAQAAVDFIGAGQAIVDATQLRPADIFMLTIPDDQIYDCGRQLIERGLISQQTVVFHCSGALCASELGLTTGAASLHPVRSFAHPLHVADHFAETICSIEGDLAATTLLTQATERIGAKIVNIPAASKTLYHAASVFASNYLVSLMDAALNTYAAAGIPADIAKQMAEPIARETLDNVFRLGTKQALTGPIARGDEHTVQRHQTALSAWDSGHAALYAALAQATRKLK